MIVFNAIAARSIVAAAALIAVSGSASAVSMSVQIACASDYYAHCSQHSPDGPGVRSCMRAAGNSLSMSCVKALIGAGEVSQAEVDRRVAANKTAAK